MCFLYHFPIPSCRSWGFTPWVPWSSWAVSKHTSGHVPQPCLGPRSIKAWTVDMYWWWFLIYEIVKGCLLMEHNLYRKIGWTWMDNYMEKMYGHVRWCVWFLRLRPSETPHCGELLRLGSFHLELTPEMARITRKNQLPNPMFWDIFWM